MGAGFRVGWRRAYPVHHGDAAGRCRAVDRAAGPSAGSPSAGAVHHRLRAGGGRAVRAHAAAGPGDRGGKAPGRPALAAALVAGGARRVGPGGRSARLGTQPGAAGRQAGDHAGRPAAGAPAGPSGRRAGACRAAAAGGLDEAADRARGRVVLPDGRPIIGVGPTANWAGKIWPAERFVALARLWRQRCRARGWRCSAARARGSGVMRRRCWRHCRTRSTWWAADAAAGGGVPGALRAVRRQRFRADAPGRAAGTPTLGLFGPTPASEYAPAGRCTAVVLAEGRRARADGGAAAWRRQSGGARPAGACGGSRRPAVRVAQIMAGARAGRGGAVLRAALRRRWRLRARRCCR